MIINIVILRIILDCPQVQAVYDYTPKQHDELGLMRGDIVKVYRKMADGKEREKEREF